MTSNQNTILRMAVAALFVAGSVGANAALIVQAGGAAFTAANASSELPITGINVTASSSNELTAGSVTTLFTPSAGQNLLVGVSLNNGAKFLAAPSLKCGDSTTSAAGVLNLGGAGSNQAVFSLGSAQTTGAISACWLSATTLTVTGAHTDVNMSITYTYGTLASSTDGGAFLKFKTGLSASKTVGDDVVAMVTGGFMTESGGVSTTLVSAGVARWTSNGSAASTATDLSVALLLGDVLGASSGSITVAGNSLAATKVTGGIWLSTATCASGYAVGIATAVGGVTSVTFSGLSPAQISAGATVCLNFTGTTAIPEGSITAKVGGTALSGYSLPSTSAMTLMTITRNGSSTRAMNIPNAASTDQAFVRVTNTSGLAGKVYGTLYGQDGAVLGTANSVMIDAATFVSNATVVLAPADLKTKLGISSDWAGRAQLVITAETPSVRAQNLIRTPNGTLVNVGGDTSTANN